MKRRLGPGEDDDPALLGVFAPLGASGGRSGAAAFGAFTRSIAPTLFARLAGGASAVAGAAGGRRGARSTRGARTSNVSSIEQ